jgi:hypothetical protein
MRFVRSYTLIGCLFLCRFISAQEKDQAVYIPFQLTAHNNLSVQAILNGQDTAQLMFHTAANSLTLIEEAVAHFKSLKFNGTTDSIKSWGGSGNSSRLSTGNLLQIGDLKWSDVSIWENKNSGPGTDGKFGIDLFEKKVIEVDFDKKLIVIHTELPAKAKKYEKLKLAFENDCMLIHASCGAGGTMYKNKFLIHTGYSGAVLLDDAFAAENKIGEKVKITGEKKLKDSFGNVITTKKVILPVVKIGKKELHNVPAGFFEGNIGRQKMSVFGGDLLKRFNFIIDAQHTYIYMLPNGLMDVDYSVS